MEEKRKANIFENCTCQQVNMARNTALQIKNAHLDCSRCWQHLQEATKKLSRSQWVGRSKKGLCFFSETSNIFFSIFDAKAYKKIKTRIYQVWKYCKDLAVVLVLFTATSSCMNSLMAQTNRFFHGFLSSSVEITSCVYTKTIKFYIIYSPQAQLISLNNSLDIIQQYYCETQKTMDTRNIYGILLCCEEIANKAWET